MSTAPSTLLSIQYLRGLAALAVVAHHTSWSSPTLVQSGVDLFFVISGFVMMLVSDREASPQTFLRARAVRIVPLYWLATLATAILTSRADPARLLMSLIFWPHRDAAGEPFPVLIPGWTLTFEMFFYVCVAAALLLPARSRLRVLTPGFLIIVALGPDVLPPSMLEWTYTSPLLLEFLAGSWLCWVWQRGKLPGARGSLLLMATGLLLWWWSHEPWNLFVRTIAYGGPMLLIVAGSLGIEASGRLPRLPWLARLGDASYALYLTHLLVQNALVPQLLSLPVLVAFPLTMVACVAVGLATHHLIDEPIRRSLNRWMKPERARLGTSQSQLGVLSPFK